MMLAAEDKKDVGLLTVKDAEPGDACKFEGLGSSDKEISFENFLKLKIITKDGKVFYDNKELKVNNESVSVEKVTSGRVR